jgi:hypothetical protein
MEVKLFINFSMFNINFGYVVLSQLVLFLYCYCNKILLDFFFACVVLLFLFFLFHNLDLELGLHLFSFWLQNLLDLVVFVLMTMSNMIKEMIKNVFNN